MAIRSPVVRAGLVYGLIGAILAMGMQTVLGVTNLN
jgi:hypothetical protein